MPFYIMFCMLGYSKSQCLFYARHSHLHMWRWPTELWYNKLKKSDDILFLLKPHWKWLLRDFILKFVSARHEGHEMFFSVHMQYSWASSVLLN